MNLGLSLSAQVFLEFHEEGEDKVREQDFDAAIEKFNLALRVYKDVADDENNDHNFEIDTKLAYCYFNLGFIYEAQGNVAQAIENYNFAQQIFDEQSKKPQNTDFYRKKGLNEFRLANIAKKSENSDAESKSSDKKPAYLFLECYRVVSRNFSNLGPMLLGEEALAVIEAYNKLEDSEKEQLDFVIKVVDCHRMYAEVLKAQHEPMKRDLHLRRAYLLLDHVSEKLNHDDIYRRKMRFAFQLAKAGLCAQERQGWVKKAKDSFEAIKTPDHFDINLGQQISGFAIKSFEVQKNPASAFISLGKLVKEKLHAGLLEVAAEISESAINIFPYISEPEKTVEIHLTLVFFYLKRAYIMRAMQLSAANVVFAQAKKIMGEIKPIADVNSKEGKLYAEIQRDLNKYIMTAAVQALMNSNADCKEAFCDAESKNESSSSKREEFVGLCNSAISAWKVVNPSDVKAFGKIYEACVKAINILPSINPRPKDYLAVAKLHHICARTKTGSGGKSSYDHYIAADNILVNEKLIPEDSLDALDKIVLNQSLFENNLRLATEEMARRNFPNAKQRLGEVMMAVEKFSTVDKERYMPAIRALQEELDQALLRVQSAHSKGDAKNSQTNNLKETLGIPDHVECTIASGCGHPGHKHIILAYRGKFSLLVQKIDRFFKEKNYLQVSMWADAALSDKSPAWGKERIVKDSLQFFSGIKAAALFLEKIKNSQNVSNKTKKDKHDALGKQIQHLTLTWEKFSENENELKSTNIPIFVDKEIKSESVSSPAPVVQEPCLIIEEFLAMSPADRGKSLDSAFGRFMDDIFSEDRFSRLVCLYAAQAKRQNSKLIFANEELKTFIEVAFEHLNISLGDCSDEENVLIKTKSIGISWKSWKTFRDFLASIVCFAAEKLSPENLRKKIDSAINETFKASIVESKGEQKITVEDVGAKCRKLKEEISHYSARIPNFAGDLRAIYASVRKIEKSKINSSQKQEANTIKEMLDSILMQFHKPQHLLSDRIIDSKKIPDNRMGLRELKKLKADYKKFNRECLRAVNKVARARIRIQGLAREMHDLELKAGISAQTAFLAAPKPKLSMGAGVGVTTEVATAPTRLGTLLYC